MTSLRKIRANRANAKQSTGPKSGQGRLRSSRNASRHGLSIPVFADPKLADDITALARAIAGPADDPDLDTHAASVAAAQMDLIRIRRTKIDVLCGALARSAEGSTEDAEGPASGRAAVVRSDDLILNGDAVRALLLIDRYERRALSRRKRAIREMACAHRKAISENIPSAANLAERSQKDE